MQAELPSPEFSRFLYTSVGGDWYWLSRLSWIYQQWQDYLNPQVVQTWVAYVAGTPAGYIELETQPNDSVEIVYFGLLPQFTGQGIGGYLLTVGVNAAWRLNPQRVWVHTCNLDGPYALANYQARGFELYDQKQHTEAVPDYPVGPWMGARTSQS